VRGYSGPWGSRECEQFLRRVSPRGDRPRFRTDVAVGNVRLLVALFCSRALSLPFLPPPTPRRLGAMVWPYPAAWQVRSAQRHFGRRQRDDDQARRVDTQRQTTDNSCERLLPVLFSTKTTINPLPGEDCAVVAEETHAVEKDQQQRNDRARGFIECSDSMEVMVQFWCQKLHTRRIRHGTHNSKGLHTWDFIASPLNKFDFYLTNRRYIYL
jgi:hypothetical protein